MDVMAYDVLHASLLLLSKCLFLLSWLFQHDPKCRDDAARYNLLSTLTSHIGYDGESCMRVMPSEAMFGAHVLVCVRAA